MWLLKKKDDNALMPVEDSSSDKDLEKEFRAKHWVVIILYLIVLMIASVYLHKKLPDPLAADKDNSHFSELRARRFLFQLSNFGPKSAGSEACERLTKNHILAELEKIKTSASAHFMISQQNPSGCFDIDPEFTICYKNVSNVVVRLSKDGKPNRLAILLNCHYDSWPTSSGGSDDLASCALMMELIRLLAHQPNTLKYDLIFLFNGAEESCLQGAHGFITQHSWRHVVRAFINLDASGSGGRELLFQAGPGNQWLLNSYLAAAVHPHCSIIAQEIFQSGMFPADTDSRVLRDHGRVPGLDIAFVQNGYWWHTEFDEARRITPGSLQRAGDNVYATLLHLLNSPYLENPAEFADQKSVFFDFFGLFVVFYSEGVANVINATLIIVVYASAAYHFTKNSDVYMTAVINYIIVIITMLAVVYIMPHLTLLIWGAMPWYSIHGLVVLIYAIPTFWAGTSTMTFLATRMDQTKKEESAKAIEKVHLVFFATILVICTLRGIASGFIIALILLQVIESLLPLATEWGTIVVHLIVSMPSYIMGRTRSNPELLIAVVSNIPSFVIVLSLLPILTLTRSNRTQEETKLIKVTLQPFGCVSSSETSADVCGFFQPIRMMQHANRLFYNKDNGIRVRDSQLYVIAQDYRGAEDIPFIDGNFTEPKCQYENNLYCEVPLYFPVSNRIPARYVRYRSFDDRPELPATKINLIHKEEASTRLNYDFSVQGSSQISIFIIPQSGWQIVNCSISGPKPELSDEPLFIFLTCNGVNCGDWMFRITLKRMEHSFYRSSGPDPLHAQIDNRLVSKNVTRLIIEVDCAATEATIHPRKCGALTGARKVAFENTSIVYLH
ncbi:peptidase, M28 family [Oesophagostomum dentatum]|uniref:FXNA-like protease n=1 Tax=Oesophagostomum dentatum TaxID=61180 RepID=A0A0B1T0G0_OESDE|nr:peptidase, M28 family [Oesophagostomum dentatum]